MLLLPGAFLASDVYGQANATLNILTLNSGQVTMGGTVDIQVTVGNTGPGSITANKVRAQISIPIAIAGALPTPQQTGLPPGWTITANLPTGSITVCNGSDIIPAGAQRQIFIKVQGTSVGGPSTINGTLLFSSGTSCTAPGTLAGDNTADNTGTTSIQVIPAPSCSLTGVSASAGTIACNGGTTILTVTPTGAAGAVEYSLTGSAPFQASNTFTVTAGTYTVTAREVGTPACIATAIAVSVAEPPAVTAPVVSNITQPTCTTATGSVNLGGLPPGSWTINPGAIPGNTATTTINGLATGTYNFTVTIGGCTSAASANVAINSQPATPAAPAAGTITQPTCAISTGSVVLNNLPPGNWVINPGAITGSTTTTAITGLASGTYNFTVTNAAGCTSSASADIVISNVTGAPPAPVVSVTQPTCTVATGIITVTSITTGFTFSLDGGTYTVYPAGGYTVAAGAHTLTAEDAGSCTSPVANITVDAQPVTPAAPVISITQPTCTISTGTITVTSATAGLTFSFDDGTYTSYPATGYAAATGVHTLKAQTASGCVSAVSNITVNTQPSAPTVSVSAGLIACFGGTTVLTAAAVGGTAPYEYSLNGGSFQQDNTFTTGAGTYTITVRDATLCTAMTSVVTVVQPTAITATIATGAIGCNGGTVTLTVSTTGGIGALQYSLNSGPFQPGNTFTTGAGSYAVTVKDANNCTITTPAVVITQPATLLASATAKRITQCGGTSEVTVTATGGSVPYTSGIGTFTSGPGTWIFSVTDAGGCTDTASVTIEAPGCMDLRVYPNPAQSSINVNHSIAATGSTIQVFEINGALVISKPVSPDAFQTTVDVSRLANGIYVLVYWNGNERKQILFKKISS